MFDRIPRGAKPVASLDGGVVSYFLFKNISRVNEKFISGLGRVQEVADCMI